MKTVWYSSIFLMIMVFAFTGTAQSAAKRPTTPAELALYKGADRQVMLEEGAKKEGKLVIYTTQTEQRITDAFQKKYPFIKVVNWRSEGATVLSRVLEEYKTNVHLVDVMSFTGTTSIVAKEAGLLQPFFSPNLASIEEYALDTASGGAALLVGHYQSGIGMGFNTKLIAKGQIPKTYQELLDPKWKGKAAIVSSGTGATWVGALLHAYGEKFVEKIAQQKFDVHSVSARALLDMIIHGEYAFSPTIMDSHVAKSKNTGAPVDWYPLEPVPSYIGQIMLSKHPPNPHAALLYVDFDLSGEAGELYKAAGYNSPRKNVSREKPYKKYFGGESTEQVQKWRAVFKKYFLKE